MEPSNPALAADGTDIASFKHSGVELSDSFETPCKTCRNFIGLGFCAAFPKGDGIPQVILLGQNNHAEPLGDEPFVWERDPNINIDTIANQGDR